MIWNPLFFRFCIEEGSNNTVGEEGERQRKKKQMQISGFHRPELQLNFQKNQKFTNHNEISKQRVKESKEKKKKIETSDQKWFFFFIILDNSPETSKIVQWLW